MENGTIQSKYDRRLQDRILREVPLELRGPGLARTSPAVSQGLESHGTGKVASMLSHPIASTDWRSRSACLDENPELFFPIGTTGPAVTQVDEAKRVCGQCEVRAECLTWALEENQDHGVWGGLSEDERRSLRRRNARARATAGA